MAHYQAHKNNAMFKNASILLFMPRPLADDLAVSLPGYDLQLASTLEETNDVLQSRPTLDAILADDQPETQHLFEMMQHLFPETQRPLLFMISGTSPLADAVLSLPILSAQIEAFLRMRVRFSQHYQLLSDENHQLKAALTQEQKLKSEIEILKNAIVRNVSHELKTPLLQVKSAVALLAEDVKDTQLIDYATGATARLEALVKNITMLGGSLEINLGPVILREAVEYARRNLRRVWEHRDQTTRVKIDIPQNLPPVLADKQGLSTVLQLLIDNALKFSKDDVEVFVHIEKKVATIAVRDYGIGIAPDQVHAIFDTFYQVDPSSTRRYGGMGIGLAIVRLILESHNTRIHVESILDQGSTFSFELPTAAF